MDMIFFTSDTHFFHKNILKWDLRPWESLEKMHDEMLERWNKKISENDDVYILGDFSWKWGKEQYEFLKQLQGHKHLILGNHDSRKKILTNFPDYFESMDYYGDIKVVLQNGQTERCILSHYFIPFYHAHCYHAILLHGHSHNTREHFEELKIASQLEKKGFPNRIYNVGCMHWNYEPVTLDEILMD